MEIDKLIQQAEAAAKSRAAEAAYKLSEGVGNRELQRTLFELCYTSVQLGTRLMQEELNKLIPKKTKPPKIKIHNS